MSLYAESNLNSFLFVCSCTLRESFPNGSFFLQGENCGKTENLFIRGFSDVDRTQKKRKKKFKIGEFWTSRQRQSHSIHYSVSYRASFKPELPAFFLDRYLSKSKGVVFDPFGGRGTTSIQANLAGHCAIHNDISPMSLFLAKSRQTIPSLDSMEKILDRLDLKKENSRGKRRQGSARFLS